MFRRYRTKLDICFQAVIVAFDIWLPQYCPCVLDPINYVIELVIPRYNMVIVITCIKIYFQKMPFT